MQRINYINFRYILVSPLIISSCANSDLDRRLKDATKPTTNDDFIYEFKTDHQDTSKTQCFNHYLSFDPQKNNFKLYLKEYINHASTSSETGGISFNSDEYKRRLFMESGTSFKLVKIINQTPKKEEFWHRGYLLAEIHTEKYKILMSRSNYDSMEKYACEPNQGNYIKYGSPRIKVDKNGAIYID